MKNDLASARPWNVANSYEIHQTRLGDTPNLIATCEDTGQVLFGITKENNAELIVRAVNNFDALREALKLAEATIQRLEVKHGGFSSVQGTLDVIKTAIKNAEK